MRSKRYEELPTKDKAKILNEYKWSSLGGYIGLGKREPFVTYGAVLGYMGGDNKVGKKRYCDFVLSGLGRGLKNPLGEVHAGTVLGLDSFREWIRKTFIDGREWTRKEQPAARFLQRVISEEEIARVVGEEYGVKPDELLKAHSTYREARRVLIEMSYRLNMSGKSLQQLGRELGGIGGDAVAHVHERMKERLSRDKILSRRIERFQKQLCQ